MNCDEAKRYILFPDELNEAKKKELDEHIASCDDCRSYADEITFLSSALDEAEIPPVSENEWARKNPIKRLAQRKQFQPSPALRHNKYAYALATVAVTVVLIIIGMKTLSPTKPTLDYELITASNDPHIISELVDSTALQSLMGLDDDDVDKLEDVLISEMKPEEQLATLSEDEQYELLAYLEQEAK